MDHALLIQAPSKALKLDLSQAQEHIENMRTSTPRILALIEGMEARKEKDFSPETAPLVIDALRLCARMKTGEPAKYKVELWDWKMHTSRRPLPPRPL